MKFQSTRNPRQQATLGEAIARGIAPDGGLYVPAAFPHFAPAAFDHLNTLPAIAGRLLAPFAAGDPLARELDAICRAALDFPAPLVPLDGTPGPVRVLELFHGPTSAFKDFGARFLAAALARIRRHAPRRLTILVATSGDTGSAVAAAFHGQPWAEVVVLYPRGLVSPRQAQQLSCWGGNVRTLAVSGTFDDCQRMVKEAFLDPSLAGTHELSSANSINIGRLLPQMVYYARASLVVWRETGNRPHFIIPTGNLGNAVACAWARHAGLPIGDIVLATNANDAIVEFLDTGEWRPRPSVATLASAMDVGNASNMERLRALYPDADTMRRHVSAERVTDDEIRERIRGDARTLGQVWCPHTATSAEVYSRVAGRRGGEHWIVVSTAHPAKFNDIVEPLIGTDVPVPGMLAALLALPRTEREIEPTLDALRAELQRVG